MMRFFFLLFTIIIIFNNCYALNLSDLWVGEAASKRRQLVSVKSDDFMISSAHPLASRAGQEIMAKNGNVIDAIIAAQMVLNVVEPQSSGIGGGGFLLYYDAKNNNYKYYNGRETAPQKSYDTMFLDKNNKPENFLDALQGGKAVATPGLLKMLKAAHDDYGKLPWQDLFKPAINLARNGYEVDHRLYVNLKRAQYLKNFSQTANLYLDDKGKPFKIGTIIKNEKLAQTLESISKNGIKPFYEGDLAKKIINKINNSKINPGFMTLSDLKNYKIKKGVPICAKYRKKYKICSMSLPSSGGITILQILGMLENFDLSKYSPNSLEAIHLISEATRMAYEDRNKYIGDNNNVPINKMLDKNYLKKRGKMIDIKKAAISFNPGNLIDNDNITKNIKNNESSETTHMSAIDKNRNAISFTSSIEYFFGSALSVEGFLLNNHMTDFSFINKIGNKKVANAVAPFKQPRSSMSPTFIFDNNKLIMTLGSPGGPRIIQYVVKTIIASLDWNMDIQEAISLPNFTVLNNVIELESGTNIVKFAKILRKMGHKVHVKDQVSGIHAIKITKDNKLIGGADPRRSGVAIGSIK
ncbi:MAG: gamma-glutamyltransferase [Rickettsiales bacterium]|jgi:gamma-glutamyltranspeptidase / glutathione hydrolase|nr:gamma-glutamyltransferase [Rickettsiales bacterium]